MPSLYTFSEYSPTWPAEFAEEAAKLQSLLGEELCAVHHIGSTSVPGLAAKPVIDLLPVARDIARIDELTPLLQQAGYKAWGEYGLPGRRFFTKDRGEYRSLNIHIYQFDDPDIERHLVFRAYLCAHDPIRVEYELLKRQAYARHPTDIAAYSDFKNAWIKRIEKVALDWYRQSFH